MTIEEALTRPTISVVDAGALFYGLSRNGSYEAAKRGDIPTVRIGKKIMVPVAPLAEGLGLRANIGRAA
ncbi:MAG: DNA-binding protein [Rhizobiaceae bacterium]|nr:DNA-binding protein [Rhizobiaceae bacterium]